MAERFTGSGVLDEFQVFTRLKVLRNPEQQFRSEVVSVKSAGSHRIEKCHCGAAGTLVYSISILDSPKFGFVPRSRSEPGCVVVT
jgi:hypothetical protein